MLNINIVTHQEQLTTHSWEAEWPTGPESFPHRQDKAKDTTYYESNCVPSKDMPRS